MDYQKEIYNYLNREMLPNERVHFEDRLKNDPNLKTQYTMEYNIIQGIKEYGRQQLKIKVGEQVNAFRTAQFIRRILFGVIALAILSAVAFYLYNGSTQNTEQKPTEVYAYHYVAPNLATGQRSGQTANFEDEVKKLYSKGAFTSLSSLMAENKSNSSISAELILMSSIALMENNNFLKAISELSKISKSDVLYFDHAQWYLGLSHLALGQIDQSKRLFTTISSDSNHDHYEDAKVILKKL